MNDRGGATIVKVAIALGQGLNLKVIAEGVETAEQLEFLQSIECDSENYAMRIVRSRDGSFDRPSPDPKTKHQAEK